MIAVAVYDLGPAAENGQRYEAQVVDYPVVSSRGTSPWDAVRGLVGGHRGLLERRWSTGGPRG
jgi:hypothetical protein